MSRKKYLINVSWTLTMETDELPDEEILKDNIKSGIENCPHDIIYDYCDIKITTNR